MIDQPLRIVLCTNGGLHGALVLDRLLASPRVDIVGIVLSSRLLRPGDGWVRAAFAYARRCGLAYTLYLWCTTSLADVVLRFSPVAPVALQARRRGIPLMATRQVNGPQGLRFVENTAADLLVSAFFNQRIDETLARIPLASTQ